ncbi:hypothetical protein, partial [Pseudomonas guariconensis]|uniref:hypothetical protein n=1 Tax=Pseudomonas guariconensis TaxID=1288410 RepID=UPI002B056C15
EALPILPEAFNSLILKEFCVSTASEVGRIIRGFETPSTLILKNIVFTLLRPDNTIAHYSAQCASPLYKRIAPPK